MISKNRSLFNILILAALMLVTIPLTSATVPAAAKTTAKVKVLITFARNPGPAEQALVRNYSGEIKYSYHLVPAIAAAVPESAIQGLRRNPWVTAVDLDAQVHVTDTELDNAWGVKRIGAGVVHASSNKGAGVKVAILDTGIDTDHPDLDYDPTCSWNFITGGALPEDGHSHGTHVAGIIAGLDNDTGIVGVAPEVTLCIYNVFDDNGDADYSDIIAALERAVTDSVQVTNSSYGALEEPSATVKWAYDNAYAAGILHVAGVGNNSILCYIGDCCIYPALWDSVIATAATTESDTKDILSSVCDEVEIAAPGTGIYSTMPDGNYGYKSGTSMASPHVAGTAALVLAANPSWSNNTVRAQLQNTADDLGIAGRDRLFGFGLVDADEAAGQPTAVIITFFIAEVQNNAILVSWRTTNEVDLLGFNLYRSGSFIEKGESLNAALIPAQSPGSLTGNDYIYLDHTVQAGESYVYWLEVVSTSGKTLTNPIYAEGGYALFLPLIVR